jgi:predicted DNA binding CopG/RHH family protein
MKKPIPEFHNEDEERAFWAENDSSDYLNWGEAKRMVFPNLKPSTRAISLRLPESMLDELRQLANQRDVPYQSLIKVFLRERIDLEHGKPFTARQHQVTTGKAGKKTG